jgi:hypothetical protein
VSTSTVVVCPPLPGVAAAYDRSDVVDALLDDPRCAGIKALSPYVSEGEADDDPRTLRAHWVAHLAVALATGGTVAPVLLVLGGTSGALAPALGFSQKASRRAVSGYVLVDAATPTADSGGADWPDAPVVYVASPAADSLEVNQARLRGWAVHEVPALSPRTIADAILSAAL